MPTVNLGGPKYPRDALLVKVCLEDTLLVKECLETRYWGRSKSHRYAFTNSASGRYASVKRVMASPDIIITLLGGSNRSLRYAYVKCASPDTHFPDAYPSSSPNAQKREQAIPMAKKNTNSVHSLQVLSHNILHINRIDFRRSTHPYPLLTICFPRL